MAQQNFLQSVTAAEGVDNCFPQTLDIINEKFIDLPLEYMDDTNETNIVKESAVDSEFTADDMNDIMEEYLDEMDDVTSVTDFESIEENDTSG